MTTVVLRDVGADDWQVWRDTRLRALRDSPTAFGSTYAREVALTETDFRARLAPESAAVLAMADGDPVGMGAGFQDRDGWLLVVAMWVEPAWRGHGIGVRVLDRLVGWAREHGLRVHLDVTVGNHGARRLYEQAGFVATGETKPLRPGSPYLTERMALP